MQEQKWSPLGKLGGIPIEKGEDEEDGKTHEAITSDLAQGPIILTT